MVSYVDKKNAGSYILIKKEFLDESLFENCILVFRIGSNVTSPGIGF